ncbi:hypothetical protein BG011_003728 [Mortierella polycephala]|uniref:Uncharacterized protein n=1 Tax=Mortierella polycephala TaxID=41804 RepID=A0A9P6U3P0_9FUNG|nr:hypothetical protein BG011_003728 [Mortierella polycephala]
MTDSLATNISNANSQSVQDHVSRQTSRLIHLLESIDYPYQISVQDVHAALLNQYQNQDNNTHASFDTSTRAPLTTPVASFVDWLIDSVSAETNWPGYQQQETTQVAPLTDDGLDELSAVMEDDGGQHDEATLQALEHEQQQLETTLMNLEKELADLTTLETHTSDANKALDMDIHDTSVQMDAILSKLEETAHDVFSDYLCQDQGKDHGMDTEMDVDTKCPKKDVTPPCKSFLYQCQDELHQVRKIDAEFMKDIEHHYKQIMGSVDLSPNISQTSGGCTASPSSSVLYFDQLMKRNLAQEQELIRLCSTYRSTKMSHIRAMARFRCLEEELKYMQELDAEHQEQDRQEMEVAASTEKDKTIDFGGLTIAGSKNLQIQKSRQQEIELISLQRESARLTQEMEQLLSDPDLDPNSSTCTRRESGVQSMGQECQGGFEVEVDVDDSRRGVLADIYERVARTDIELRFLKVAHQDYMRQHEYARKGLESVMDQLLEYYSLGVLVEQVLGQEKTVVQRQKDVLWAAVQECQEMKEQSQRMHGLSNKDGQRQTGGGGAEKKNVQERANKELRDIMNRSDRLKQKLEQEHQWMQGHMQEAMNVKECLDHRLLHQHSSTNQVQLVPRKVHIAKEDLVEQTRQLQQEYAELCDGVQQVLHSKEH